MVELDETEDITLLQNGAPMTTLAVTPGETITFRIHNTAQDVDHEFFIGPTDKLANDVEGGLTGGPVNAGQTVDVTYTVTANSIGLQMGCPLLGHYVTMHADLVAAP